MKAKKISFISGGHRLNGKLYLPTQAGNEGKIPVVIVASGYTGLNAIYPYLFAKVFTKAGYGVLGFDYRGLGESDGPRGRIILDEEVEDLKNAIAYIQTRKEVDFKRLGIIGWAMGGGLAVKVAAKSSLVRNLAVLNGFYNGREFLEYAFSRKELVLLYRKINEDKKQRLLGGGLTYTDPFVAYPLDPDTEQVVDRDLRPVKHYNIQTSFEIADSIMTFNSLNDVRTLKIPLFVAHGKENKLHDIKQSEQLYRMANGPKELYLIDGKHNDFMKINHPEFKKLSQALIRWFNLYL